MLLFYLSTLCAFATWIGYAVAFGTTSLADWLTYFPSWIASNTFDRNTLYYFPYWALLLCGPVFSLCVIMAAFVSSHETRRRLLVYSTPFALFSVFCAGGAATQIGQTIYGCVAATPYSQCMDAMPDSIEILLVTAVLYMGFVLVAVMRMMVHAFDEDFDCLGAPTIWRKFVYRLSGRKSPSRRIREEADE